MTYHYNDFSVTPNSMRVGPAYDWTERTMDPHIRRYMQFKKRKTGSFNPDSEYCAKSIADFLKNGGKIKFL